MILNDNIYQRPDAPPPPLRPPPPPRNPPLERLELRLIPEEPPKRPELPLRLIEKKPHKIVVNTDTINSVVKKSTQYKSIDEYIQHTGENPVHQTC